jgi:zinc protease
MNGLGRALLAAWLCFSAGAALAEPRASTFTLDNGLQVVVIPDHRVPVVTHMVWYRTGAADDPWGHSGIAHFLEHLMFKSTGKLKSGDFTRTITRLGGRDNAATAHDTTSYFQRLAKEHLRTVMELEADRMVNLQLVAEEVDIERNVVQEERRSTIDGVPLAVLSEQMLAVLYHNHPYGRPALGWAHEIAKFSRADAVAFYQRSYAPNNALLVVAGDVTVDEVRPLAQATYGVNKPNPEAIRRPRATEPAPTVARRVTLEDARTGPPVLVRFYDVPSFFSASAGEGESLDLLAHIIGGDDTSRLYRHFVAGGLAATAGTTYLGNPRDSGRLAFIMIPSQAVPVDQVEAALDAILDDVRKNGVKQDELDRAKSSLETRRIFESDNQMTLARRYGEGLAIGRSIADIESVPQRIRDVSLETVNRVAQRFLVSERSVTGILKHPIGKMTTPVAKSP